MEAVPTPIQTEATELWRNAGFREESFSLFRGKECLERLKLLAAHQGLASELQIQAEHITSTYAPVVEHLTRYSGLRSLAHESRPVARAMLSNPQHFFHAHFGNPYSRRVGSPFEEVLSAGEYSIERLHAFCARKLLHELMPHMFDSWLNPDQALFLLARPFTLTKCPGALRNGLRTRPAASTLSEIEQVGDSKFIDEVMLNGHPALTPIYRLNRMWIQRYAFCQLAFQHPLTLRELSPTLPDWLKANGPSLLVESPPAILLEHLLADQEHQIRLGWLKQWMPDNKLHERLKDRVELTQDLFAHPAMLFLFKNAPQSTGSTLQRPNLTVAQLEKELTNARNWKIFSEQFTERKEKWQLLDWSDPDLCCRAFEQSDYLALLDPTQDLGQNERVPKRPPSDDSPSPRALKRATSRDD